ncbi:MAG TPA: peptidylprolyl isomerase [Longimicrobiales bacterium]
MMRTMRENTKWIMLITALAFVGLMVFQWGMDLTGRSSAQMSGGRIGSIDGDPVSYQEFLAVYRNLYDQQQVLQKEPIGTAQNREIEQAAWDQLVMDRLIAREIARRDLDATDAEVRAAARAVPPPEFQSNPMFQTDGRFDPNKYYQFLASPAAGNQLLLQLEAYYRTVIPRSKLYRQVTAGTYLSDSELWRIWRDRNETVRIRYISIDPLTTVPDAEVSVSDEEIARFYEEHRDDLQHSGHASVRWVAVDKTPTAADTAAARSRALELRAEILRGADFAEVARRESADSVSAANGGDLGTFSRGQMVAAFDDAVWSLPIGRVSEPVQTSFGFHLIRVQSRKGDQASARHILIPIERTPASEDSLLTRVDSLEALGETMSLADAAASFGLQVQTVDIDPDLPIIAGIGRIDDGADWAFHEAEPGMVSPIFESSSAFYMLELVERVPAGVYTLEEATPQIRSGLVIRKKTERARQEVRNLIDQIRNSSLEEAAAAAGLEVHEAGPFTRTSFVPGIGRANAVIGTAFGLEDGETSGLVEAGGVLYVIQTIEHTPADRAKFDEQKATLRTTLAAAAQQARWNQFLANLRENADIVDNREQVLNAAGA